MQQEQKGIAGDKKLLLSLLESSLNSFCQNLDIEKTGVTHCNFLRTPFFPADKLNLPIMH